MERFLKSKPIFAVGALALLVGALMIAPAKASTADPAVWVGSPFSGNWSNNEYCAGAQYPSDLCSLPTVHHIVYYNPVGGFSDDWATDLQGVSADTPVYLYAAPQIGGLPITARVETVGQACSTAYGSMAIPYGGYRVTIAFYDGATRIGTMTYAHINPVVSQGATINRWGTLLGKVGSYIYSDSNRCWKGAHVHIEMSSQHNYACYNRGWHTGYPLGQHMNPTNFIGFIGGNYASTLRQPCP